MGAPLICLTTGMVAVQSKPTKCRFFNGPMEYEYSYDLEQDDIAVFWLLPKSTIGRALCEDEIRSIQQGAHAGWNKVITCRNPSSVPIKCSYSKTVGVTKSSSETSSNGFSASQAKL